MTQNTANDVAADGGSVDGTAPPLFAVVCGHLRVGFCVQFFCILQLLMSLADVG